MVINVRHAQYDGLGVDTVHARIDRTNNDAPLPQATKSREGPVGHHCPPSFESTDFLMIPRARWCAIVIKCMVS